MIKKITVNDKEITLKASALLPRLYRVKFGRDMVVDMRNLAKNYNKVIAADMTDDERVDAQLSVLDIEIFENVAWLMIKHADPNAPGSPEEWLDSLDGVFSIYEVLPTVLELWGLNQKTTSIAKKN